MKRIGIALLLLSMVAMLWAGGAKEGAAAAGSAPAEKQSYEFKLGHLAPVGDPRHEALTMFADQVAEKSGGRIKIVVHPNSTLGSERELFEQVRGGITEFALIGSVVGNFVPEFASMDLPYLWKSQEHLRNVLTGEIGQQWQAKMKKEFGVGVLGFFDRNPRILVNTKRPVKSIKDIQGMKVRVPEIQMHMDTWRAFGVQPTPMPASEFYMGLKMGVIDAMENPVEVMYTWKIYEVAKYLSKTEHIRSALYFINSDQVMNKLSDEDRQIIRTAAEAAELWHNNEVARLQSELYKKLEAEGMVVVYDVDKSGFIEASKKIHQQYMQTIGEETYKKIVAAQ